MLGEEEASVLGSSVGERPPLASLGGGWAVIARWDIVAAQTSSDAACRISKFVIAT